MKTYVYVLTLCERLHDPAAWTKLDNEIIEAHFNHIKAAYEEKRVLHVGRTENPVNGFGLVIYKTENDEEASSFMQSDPAVKHQLMQAQCYPYLWIFSK